MSTTPLAQALERLAQQDETGGFQAVARLLFPGWEPKRSCRAPHREDKNASFSVYKNESGEWRFKDFSDNTKGGLVGFVMLAGMDEKQASRWLMEQAGITRQAGVRHVPQPKCEKPVVTVPKVPPMPVEAMARLGEGIDYAQAHPEEAAKVAELRGWPEDFARYLVECTTIAMPLHRGERTLAFSVSVPEAFTGSGRGGIVMRDVGYHCRVAPQSGDTRVSWRFVPNEREHRQSIPALPFIIGGGWFDTARLIIITEGQWDSLTFALAAGWLGDGCEWPDGVCVVGIRGSTGTATFLKYYRRFWSRAANCLLLPDSDRSGTQWFDGDAPFSAELAGLCRKVAIVRCGEHKDFNDLYRVERVTPDQITELLASHGMSLEGEVTA